MAVNFYDQLDSFLKYDTNWDTYGAPPIDVRAVAAAKAVVVTPTVNGGVEVSWKSEQVAVEFNARGEIVAVHWDATEANA